VTLPARQLLQGRRAKIVCTLGPASCAPEVVAALIEAGMDVARLNMSHGSQDSHRELALKVREAAARARKPVALLIDLQGPKLRTGALATGQPLDLRRGDRVMVTPDADASKAGVIAVDYETIAEDVRQGDKIILGDGEIELRVTGLTDNDVLTEVDVGGLLGPMRGIHLPHSAASVPAITEKDKRDLKLAVELQADYIALSFVRQAEDIRQLRALLRRYEADVPVIAKLEKHEALTNLEEILVEADAVMIARGDMGVELGPEEVPVQQRRIISQSAQALVGAITATQMLDSMIDSPRPTRAEASDVANAVWDGTDALMLSGETAIGKFPVQTVAMMDRIIRKAESAMLDEPQVVQPNSAADNHSVVIGLAARQIAGSDPNVKAIVAYTKSGYTARLISKERPTVPILALTPSEAVYRQLALAWGVVPVQTEYFHDERGMMRALEAGAAAAGLVEGDEVVIVGSLPVEASGTTNFLKLHTL
jgi:pyruvate kinase